MSENREEILADFQACTGIEDVGEALGHLEESRWDLLAAVNRVMPQETQTLPSEQEPDVEMLAEIPAPRSASSSMVNGGLDLGVHVSLNSDFGQVPSTSFGKMNSRLLHFHINYGEAVIPLQISDSSCVRDLKLLLCSKTKVPICQQVLTNWKGRDNPSDDCVLSSLGLPRENLLFLTGPDQDKVASNISELLTKKYTLKIRDEVQSRSFVLNFEGSKSIGEVKAAVSDVTDIPVRNQLWQGWPIGVVDKNLLAQVNLTQPEHELAVRQKKDYKRIIVDLADSDSSVEEFEDASESFTGEDEIFIEEVGTKKLQPLIPDNVEDETAGCLHFNDEFTNRYGGMHPEFFAGTLDDAIKEACFRPAKERRLLAVYLHHDGSVLTNVFCTQLLCFESVLQYLHNNFVVWGWDLTFESNKLKLLSSISRNLGSVAAVTVRNIDMERLPALIIIMRMRSNTEIFTIVNGNIGVNELLSSLIQAVEVFSEQQRQEIKEEEERSLREMIKIEQDQAYQASLEIDRAKEEAKQQQIRFENLEKERVENARQEAEAKKEAERRLLGSRLPEEPSDGSQGITKIRFRLPRGQCLERRFLAHNKLQVLLDYLIIQGYHINEYKVIASWPRRDLTTLDVQATLQELELCPQETVTLEER